MAAGRAWARGDLTSKPAGLAADDALADAALFGLPQEAVAGLAARSGFAGVWPDNLPAALAFCAAGTQLRTASAGAGVVFIGLDYAAAKVAWEASAIGMTPEIFAGVRLIEAGAVEALNARG